MRKHVAALLSIILSLVVCGEFGVASLAGAQQAGVQRAAAHDSHEGVTISVEPWTQATSYKEKFPRKSPLVGGVVAMKVTIRNNSDESVKVDLQRIRLMISLDEENRQELVPLTADEVADAVLLKSGKDPTARRSPLPLPIPIGKSAATRDKKWSDFRDDCQNAAMPSPVVAAGTAMDGLLYFDLRGEWDLLQTAKLYVPNLTTMSSHTPLSYFEIDLGRGSGD